MFVLFLKQMKSYRLIFIAGMTMRLWNYVSTFSNLSGERLHQIYSKLKQEKEVGAGPSYINGTGSALMGRDGDSTHFGALPRHFQRVRGNKNNTSFQISEPVQKGVETGKFEAWKRRRRGDADNQYQVPCPPDRPVSNGGRIPDPNSLGILGAAPTENRRFANERPYRIRQTSFPVRQG